MEGIKRFFSTVWEYWKKFGLFMGNVVGRVILTIFYLTIALPFGLGARMFSDALHIRKKHLDPKWTDRDPTEATIEAAYNQF